MTSFTSEDAARLRERHIITTFQDGSQFCHLCMETAVGGGCAVLRAVDAWERAEKENAMMRDFTEREIREALKAGAYIMASRQVFFSWNEDGGGIYGWAQDADETTPAITPCFGNDEAEAAPLILDWILSASRTPEQTEGE